MLATALAFACSTSDAGGGSAQIVACREEFTGCPLDPVPSLAETQSCTGALDGPCGNAALVYRGCVTGACTDAGFTDFGGIALRCYNEQLSFQQCLDALDAGVGSSVVPDASDPTTPTPSAITMGTTAPPDGQDAASSEAADAGSAPVDAAAPADAATPAGDAAP